MSDQAGDFGEVAMNLHNQSSVLTTVEGVLEFAVDPQRTGDPRAAHAGDG